jgi:hypothetical protein
VKRKAIVIIVLLILFILIGVSSYLLGTKSNSFSLENKESAKTGLTPTVTLEPAETATESSEITLTITPGPSATLTPTSAVTPTKTFTIPSTLLRKVATPTPTPTPKLIPVREISL